MPDSVEAMHPQATAVRTWHFQFTGTGADYFRLWIVNLLLTIATCGVYSAWAKVRRLQYFARNTQLNGAAFDFRGDPYIVLRGRIVAVLLVLAYRLSFSIAPQAWIAGLLGAVLLLPFLIQGALRFRLSNTYYRGIAFDFAGSIGAGYRAYMPVILLLLLPGADVTGWEPAYQWDTAFILLVPLVHMMMIRYRVSNIWYGNLPARVDFPGGAIWRIYLKNGGGVLLFILLTIVLGALGMHYTGIGVTYGPTGASRGWAEILQYKIIPAYCLYYVCFPLVTARLVNLVWSHTSLPGVTIRADLAARTYVRLYSVNLILTLLTLGLYRPFAVVNVYRYQLSQLTLQVDGDFEERAAAVVRPARGAAGEGAADLIGFDISL